MIEKPTDEKLEQGAVPGQESLVQRVAHLQTLTHLNQLISSSLEIGQVLCEITKAAARLMNASIVTIWEVDETAQTIKIKAFSEEKMDVDFHIRKHPFGEGGVGWVAEHRQPLNIPDVFADKRITNRDWWQAFDLKSFFGFPIFLGHSLVAILGLGNQEPFHFEPEDQALLENLAAQAAIAIKNARLFEEIRKQTVELEQVNTELQREAFEHKQAEKALRENEERYRMIIQTAMDGFWLTDTNGNFLEVNAAYAQMSGYSIEELMNMRIADIEASENPGVVARHIQKGIEFGFDHFETLHRRKDDSTFDVQVIFRYLPIEGGRFVAFLHDITNRKKAEEKLRESEAFIKAVLDNLPIGIAVNSVDPTVEFEYMNDNFPKYYRTTREKLADPDAFWESVYEDPGFREEIKKRVLDDCAGGDPKRMYWSDVPITRKGEETLFITASNIPIPDKQLMISIVWDVTERKQAEEAIKESEERYRSLIELNPDSIYVYREEKIVYANRTMLDIMGAKSEDELIGQTVYDLIHPDYREKAKQRFQQVIEEGISVPLEDFIFLRLDTGETHVQAIASPVIFRGEPAVLSTMRDISGQRKAEKDKERLEDQLRQAYKMEAIGTLAGGIAHDFNNILSPIMINSELAIMDLPPDSPLRDNLEQIFHAGERARDMVKQILAFSRKEQEERTPIRLGAVLKEAIKLLRSSIPTTIDIRFNIEAEIDIVLANHIQIQQVILNLYTNASHAMREKGGVLEVGLSDYYFDSEAAGEMENLDPGSYLRLIVKDTGHGIEPEVINRIFDPYFTTKATGEGTGMGLSVAHGIVRSHGGDIMVDSEPGKETTFQVLFPKYKADIPKVVKQAVHLPRGTERILFVDDEKGAVDAIQPMLERLGYKVTARTSSIEALEAFRNSPQGVDLVVTDMTMPNMTGKVLAKELIAIRPDIPVILCTGFSDQINEKNARAIGIAAFVMKPIIMHEIANTLREVLDKK